MKAQSCMMSQVLSQSRTDSYWLIESSRSLSGYIIIILQLDFTIVVTTF